MNWNPTIRLILLTSAGFYILIGIYLKGGFTSSRYRARRIGGLVWLLTGGLIFCLAASTTGIAAFPAQRAMGNLIRPAVGMGRVLAAWIPPHGAGITAGGLGLFLLASGGLLLWKKKTALPLVLLLFAFGAALAGGYFLSLRSFLPAYILLGLSVLYAWLNGRTGTGGPAGGRPSRSPTAAMLAVAIIILLGFVLRTYGLGEVSYRFDHYEADYGREALKVLAGRHNVNLWSSTIWRGLGHLNFSPVYTYFTALFFHIFGATIITLKLVSVAWGIAALLLTYGIASTLFGRKVALITVFLLAVSPLHINYSRFGLLLGSTLTMSLLIVFLLLRALLKEKLIYFLLLGVTISFAGYFYSPAKYPVLLSAVLIAGYIVFKRKWILRNWPGLIVLGLTVFVLMTALNIPAWDLMAPRFAGYESVWHRTAGHQYTPEADYRRGIPLVRENWEKLVRSFFVERNFNYDPWPRGNLYFNPVIPPLVLLGIAFSLARIRKANYRLLLFFTAAFLVPNLLSRPPVMVRRLMVSWPFLYCLAAVPLAELIEQLRSRAGRAAGRTAGGVVVGGLLLLGAYNSTIFFESRQPAGRWEEERFFDEYAKSLVDDYYLFIVPIQRGLSEETIRFLLHEKMEAGARGYRFLRPREVEGLSREEVQKHLPAALVAASGTVSRAVLEKAGERLGDYRIEEYRDKFNRPRATAVFFESAGDTHLIVE
ncbi:MAG: glycosyltransferase family 39 protein [Candidatus Erginobacter occultus]|nr:glycosyltransferase family 39 protein [Candidatus Erginobacter occultus]